MYGRRLRVIEATDVVAVALDEGEARAERQRVAAVHALPARYVVTASAGARVYIVPAVALHVSTIGLTSGSAPTHFSHGLFPISSVCAARPPESDVAVLVRRGINTNRLDVLRQVQRAPPSAIGDILFVVVVPHAMDSDLLEGSASVVPPLVVSLANEVDMAALAAVAAVAAARAPQTRHGRLARQLKNARASDSLS